MATILLIGKRARILDSLKTLLEQMNHKVICTNDLSNLEEISTETVDVVAFGRALTDVQIAKLEEVYRKDNPNLAFVHGLAPIPPLLAAQIEAALTKQKASKLLTDISCNTTTQTLFFTSHAQCQVSIHAWWLNWLYRSKVVEIMPSSTFEPGNHIIAIPPRVLGKRAIFVIRAEDEVYVVQ